MYSTQTKAYTETSVITLALAISRGNWSFVNRFYILFDKGFLSSRYDAVVSRCLASPGPKGT